MASAIPLAYSPEASIFTAYLNDINAGNLDARSLDARNLDARNLDAMRSAAR